LEKRFLPFRAYFGYCTPVAQGFAAVLTDFALSGLNKNKQPRKGGNTLTMGVAHRSSENIIKSPERAKYINDG